jgi:bifunctional non-homologous end joining protein LigD
MNPLTPPMLATLTEHAFSDSAWVYEPKLDGKRSLLWRRRSAVRLLTRNEKDRTSHYPDLTDAILRDETPSLIADGEIVAFAGDVTSFSRLQRRMQNARPSTVQVAAVPVYYYLFDLIWFDGHDLSALPLLARKSLLRGAFAFADPIRFSEHLDQDGESAFRAACEKGWEGLVAKRGASPYAHARSRDWLKFKCSNEQEFIVIGWTEPKGARSGLGCAARRLLRGRRSPVRRKGGHRVRRAGADDARRSPPPSGAIDVAAARHQGDRVEGCALGATAARGTGRVRGMDPRRQAPSPSLPRPSRRQGAGADRARARMTS